MANIRKQFTENKNLTGYKKKKYVCKIIYLYMLGYDVDFGHVEAINLLSSSKFSEKQVVRIHCAPHRHLCRHCCFCASSRWSD
jgi:AP-2 complex subunit alpha